MKTTRLIVEIQPKMWLATWNGDPGRTCVETSAREFKTEEKAIRALERARIYSPFKEARIYTKP